MECFVVDPKGELNDGQRQMRGKQTCIAKDTAFNVMSREACVFQRAAPQIPRIRLWAVRRDDSSRVLIGAAGRSRSDWRSRNVGALIGQSACRLLVCACEQQSIPRAQVLAAACNAATTSLHFTTMVVYSFV